MLNRFQIWSAPALPVRISEFGKFNPFRPASKNMETVKNAFNRRTIGNESHGKNIRVSVSDMMLFWQENVLLFNLSLFSPLSSSEYVYTSPIIAISVQYVTTQGLKSAEFVVSRGDKKGSPLARN